MTQRLAGKTALITGAAQGLGAGIALALAREGARVVATDRNEAGALATAAGIDAELGADTACAIRHDVTSEDDWQAALAFAADRLGGLSVLVNNAGIVTMGSVEDLDLAAWRQAMAVNADSAFIGSKYALPLLRESQPASIVNMSSISALVAGANLAAYNASKAALWMLTKSVALHCAKQGWNVRCNSVHPTFVRTPLLDGIVGSHEDEAKMAKLARQVPIGRIGEVADVAAAVVYLASDESAMMTGSELKLDGGMSAM
ncbi:glucose 1-dehydrogenase [Novosphingobium sp. G106]|uniref:SDR family oxidoreductase n=1 Tax=Novosphingobium sp. G106 TaxID=2849500 RepID=UPI001C2D6CB4|nr:SDR family oxidoreductase [Novosphingobium sp. G106]MBV1686970.1 glucose 1-dehydrogenase [Novosphingobium sp. G106]